MAEVPSNDTDDARSETITHGYFEEEFYISADEAGAFLVDLGEQLQDSDEITLTGDDWELPFTFGDPVKLDIEYEGDGEPELEIEVELDGRRDDDTPSLA